MDAGLEFIVAFSCQRNPLAVLLDQNIGTSFTPTLTKRQGFAADGGEVIQPLLSRLLCRHLIFFHFFWYLCRPLIHISIFFQPISILETDCCLRSAIFCMINNLWFLILRFGELHLNHFLFSFLLFHSLPLLFLLLYLCLAFFLHF